MAPGFNMYNMNMNGNPWMQLASQGLGMFCGNSMGFGIGGFGSLTGMGCGSIFTNCYGEPNYDAMAGFGVANALLGVAGQAWATHQANKEPEVNYNAELKKILDQIEDKAEEAGKLEKDNAAQQNKYDEAGLEIDRLKGSATTDAKNNLDRLDTQIKELEKEGKKPPESLNIEFKQAKELLETTIPNQIKKQEEIQTKAKEAIEANNRKLDDLNKEIKALKEKAKPYQEKVNQQTVQNTHIEGKKSDKDSAENWYSLRTASGVDKKSCPAATQEQLKRAHTELASAMKKGDAEKIAKWKKIFIEMYESNETTFQEIPGYQKLYNAINK